MKKFVFSHFQNAVILGMLYLTTITVFYVASITDYIPYDSLSGVRFAIFLILAPIIIKYVIQLVTVPFYSIVENSREKKSKSHSGKLVSVLIPAWNEEVGILKTLESVLNSQYDNLEVIVINDGSTDSTHQLVIDFLKRYEQKSLTAIKIKYLRLANGGKAKALNQGLKLSSGDFVITIDADSVIDKDAITNLLRRFTDDSVAAVAGNVIVGNRKKSIELMQQLEYLYGFFFKRADSTFNSVYIIGGAAAAYRRSILLEVGGFDDEIITEDIEMSTRILGYGYKTRYAADAVVYTEGPSEWKGLCNQRLRWKFGRILTFIKHKELFFSSKQHHHPYLTFLILPLAVYAEFTLLFEGLLLTIFYGYTIISHDYFPLLFVILFLSSVITLQIIFDARTEFHSNLLLLAPVAWIIFYIIDMVEFQALCRSLVRLKKRETLQWQKWTRVGLMEQSQVPNIEYRTEVEESYSAKAA